MQVSEGTNSSWEYGTPASQKINKAVKRALALKIGSNKSIKIVAALVDAVGEDAGHEKISLKNNTDGNVDLNGWSIEVKGKKQKLNVILAAGETKDITLDGKTAKLVNTGSTISLLNTANEVVHTVTYNKKQVKKGTIIKFQDLL